ncbi:MAG: hypothetical protein KAT71_08235 [Gammaproteobacteria bacterium]|nr:hypothetical protein [Gammaproteobacteria bacterium]
MATIKIKGRREELKLADDKARAIASARDSKDKDTRVSIQHGAGMVYEGTLGDIAYIEYAKAENSGPTAQEATQAEEREARIQWGKFDLKTRTRKCMAPFKLWYAMRYSAKVGDAIPEAILKKAEAVIAEYLKEHTEWAYLRMPHEIYVKVLPKDAPVIKKPANKIAKPMTKPKRPNLVVADEVDTVTLGAGGKSKVLPEDVRL